MSDMKALREAAERIDAHVLSVNDLKALAAFVLSLTDIVERATALDVNLDGSVRLAVRWRGRESWTLYAGSTLVDALTAAGKDGTNAD